MAGLFIVRIVTHFLHGVNGSGVATKADTGLCSTLSTLVTIAVLSRELGHRIYGESESIETGDGVSKRTLTAWLFWFFPNFGLKRPPKFRL